jgi:hypothetical protein
VKGARNNNNNNDYNNNNKLPYACQAEQFYTSKSPIGTP